MNRSRLRKSLLISALAAASVAAVRAVRGGPVPAFQRTGDPRAPWPTLRAETTPDWAGPAAAPPDAGPLVEPPTIEPPAIEAPAIEPPAIEPSAIEPPTPDAGPLVEPPAIEPPAIEAPAVEGPIAEAVEAAASAAWLAATTGPPPVSHPVKAKLGSGIYHLPGMMNYERTKPDRYYRSAADAEADGLRAAKR